MSTEIKGVAKTISEIREKLNTVENYMIWLIKPEVRFRIGHRVEWSRLARKRGYPTRKCAQRGRVKAINGFSILVQLDGLKKPKLYHHAFFNPVNGSKLF
ncbi:MAG: hypothetical protein DMF62_00405 [Acidobacteria bacterium]|nr:MAG: hypothetical protein DMF62_00405 [Acidobacteriota bacterium]